MSINFIGLDRGDLKILEAALKDHLLGRPYYKTSYMVAVEDLLEFIENQIMEMDKEE